MIIGINGKIGSGKDTIGNIIQYLTDKNVTTESFEFWYASNFYSVYQATGLFKVKKFANKLKDITCLLINCTREQLENHDFKNKELGEEWRIYSIRTFNFENKLQTFIYASKEELIKAHPSSEDGGTICDNVLTPRSLLQLLGTDCGRNIIHPNIWVNSLMSEYNDFTYSREELISISEKNGNAVLNNDWSEITTEEIKIRIPAYLLKNKSNWIITDMRFPNELNAVKQKNGITIRVNRDNGTRAINTNPHESETALDNATFDYTIENDGTLDELIDKVKKILIKEKLL